MLSLASMPTYQPIVFLHTQEVMFGQYLASLTVADAFLVTSLREGMALRTHEFVECQEETPHSDLHNHVVTQTAQAFVTSFRCLRANTEHTAQTDLVMVPVVNMGCLLPRV